MSDEGRTYPWWHWIGPGVIAMLLLIAVAALVAWLWSQAHQPKVSDPTPAPLALLMEPIPDGPDAGVLRRGRYLAIAGDCVSCHTRVGGRPFNGGRGIKTPFGVIYSPNITGLRATGIGGWTNDQFYRALNSGIDDDGHHLYPAFPFPHFTVVTRADSDAILAYLKSVPGDAYRGPPNALPFPLNLRVSAAAWQLLFFDRHAFKPDSSKSAAWNRGAYLVRGLGHCGACHTPTNAFGAETTSKSLQGGKLNNWVAPDLTANARTGLGAWSATDIVEYLKTGRNARSDAAGPMAEVVSYSTSLLSDADLNAIATYLKDLPAGPRNSSGSPSAAAMASGGAIYGDACTACHHAHGEGSPHLFPPLAGSAVTQQRDPTSLVHLILTGGRAGPPPARPATPSMPSFAWKLTDQEIADVATYVRNAWSNRAAPVSAEDVSRLRAALGLRPPVDQANRSAAR